MPQDNNFGNSPDSFFVKHPLILGGMTTLLLFVIVGLWFYYDSRTTLDNPSDQIPQLQTEQTQLEIIQTLPTPATNPETLKKMMQELPQPQTTQTQTTQTNTATTTNPPPITEEKLLKTLPPPMSI